MFEELIETNDSVKKAFKEELKSNDIEFIKQLICKRRNVQGATGRPKDKDFLYEIVSNDENGIDVDKFDYFARDCYHLGYKNSFDHNRLMKFAKVIEVEEDDGARKKHICYPDKEVENIYDFFYQRAQLHHRTCQHKTIKVIELMHMEALRKANDYLTLVGKDGRPVSLAKSVDDMTAFTKLTDGVFEKIRLSADDPFLCEGLGEARALLKSVDDRKHYKCVGEAMAQQQEQQQQERHSMKVWRPFKTFGETMKDEKVIAIEIAELSDDPILEEKDICVNVVKFDYGKDYDNPVNSVFFYNKRDSKTGKKLLKHEVSEMLPSVFYEQHVRVYAREEKNIKKVEKAFRNWCRDKNYTIIKDFGPLGEQHSTECVA
jgi:HD superfamily phosphohydrolase